MPGKTKSTSNSTQTNTAYAPVKPVIDQGAGIMQDYLSNPKSNAVYQGPRVAGLSGDTQAGLGLMRGSTGANGAMDFYKQIMDTPAGGNNPAIQAMQDQIRRQVMATNAAQFSNAGMTGGTLHQGSLARGISDGLAQPLFASYENDMARRMAAAGGYQDADQTRIGNQMGAGQVMDSFNQAKINANMNKFEEQRTSPMRAWSEVAPLATQIGSQFGTQNGTQTSVQKQQQSPLAMAGGALMAGAGLMTGNPMMAMGALGGGGGLFGGGGGGASAPWSMPSVPYASNGSFNLNSLFGGR